MKSNFASRYQFILVLFALFSISGCKDGFLYRQQASSSTIKINPKISEISSANKVDIIFQVGGMKEQEQNLLTGANSFISYISKQKSLDWKLGVLSSSTDSGEILGFGATDSFDYTSADPIQTFNSRVQYSIDHYDGEQTMDPIVDALTQYPDFVRNDALLVLIVSNDEIDMSFKNDAPAFLDFLQTLKGDLGRVQIYGVMGSIDLGCDSSLVDSTWNFFGSSFDQIINATKGAYYPLCGKDFGVSLGKIGDLIVEQTKHPRIFLASRPNPATIVVNYQGKSLPAGPENAGGVWYYDPNLNAIVFSSLDFSTNPTDSVSITYEPGTGL